MLSRAKQTMRKPGARWETVKLLSGVRSGCAAALFTGVSGGTARRSVLKSKQEITAQSPQLVEISAATVNFWSCRGLVCWKTAGAWPAACCGFTAAAFQLRTEETVLERWSRCGTWLTGPWGWGSLQKSNIRCYLAAVLELSGS